MNNIFLYIESLSVLCIFYIALFFLQRQNRKKQNINSVDFIYISFILTIVLDILWSLINKRPDFIFVHNILQIVYISILQFTGYAWLLHLLQILPAKHLFLFKIRRLLLIPTFIIISLIISSPETGLIFIVNESGEYFRGSLYLLPVFVCYYYMLLASYVAVKCSTETISKAEKSTYLAYAFFAISPVVLSAIQMILPPGIPTMQAGVFISLLIVFGISQNNLITRDFLTNLPNRFSFETALKEKIDKYNFNFKHFIIMFDLDDFKSINDNFGHLSGDKALKITAETLKKIFSNYKAIVYRIMGDEFIVLIDFNQYEDSGFIKHINKKINLELKNNCQAEEFLIKTSMGIVEYNANAKFNELLKFVDSKLYEQKRIKKVH